MMETEEEVAAADELLFAKENASRWAGKTTEQIRADAEALLIKWRAAPKSMAPPWWVVQ